MWELLSVTDEKLVLWNEEEHHAHEIPWGAIGTWGALLGTENDEEAVAYIQAVGVGDAPEPDWATLYSALAAPLAEQERNKLEGMPQPLTMAILESAGERERVSAKATLAEHVALPVVAARGVAATSPISAALLERAEQIALAKAEFIESLRPKIEQPGD